MSTVQEITAAIRKLGPKERRELASELSALLPELESSDGDAAWENIIHDPRPCPALTALGDEIEAQLAANPEVFPEITPFLVSAGDPGLPRRRATPEGRPLGLGVDRLAR